MRAGSVVVLLSGAVALFGQLPELERQCTLTASDSVVVLGVYFVQELELLLDSLYQLQPGLDYQLDAQQGLVHLTPHFRRLFHVRDTVVLVVHGSYIPLPLLSRRRAAAVERTARIGLPEQEPSAPLLQPRGMLSRGFSVQSGSAVALTSAVELQLQSQLPNGVSVSAQMSSQQLPLGATGASASLEQFDQLRLRLQSSHVQLELGTWQQPLLPGALQPPRRFHGIRMELHSGALSGSAVLGAAAGTPAVNHFFGSNGMQGPYRLRGASGEERIVIVPNSERVYVDGILRERGEERDYVVDYLRAELFFRPRCPISAASRITVEFEYTDESAAHTVMAFGAGARLGHSSQLRGTYVQENTTPFAELTDVEATDYRDGRFVGWSRAVRFVGRDSLSGRGLGWYRRRYTVIAGKELALWEYAPGSPEALYAVDFSYVGPQRGSYTLVAPGVFRFVGLGKGEYEPGRQVSLPMLRRLWSLSWEWQPLPMLQLQLGWDVSQLHNRFRSGERLAGDALRLQSRWNLLRDTSARALLWESQAEWRSARFAEFGMRSPEVRRFWEDSAAEGSPTERLLLLQQLRYRTAELSATVGIGWARYGTLFHAGRYELHCAVHPTRSVSASLDGELVQSRTALQDGVLKRQRGNLTAAVTAELSSWQLRTRLRWEREPIGTDASRSLSADAILATALSDSLWLELPLQWRQIHGAGMLEERSIAAWLRWRRADLAGTTALGWRVFRSAARDEQFLTALTNGVWRFSAGQLQWNYELGHAFAAPVQLAYVRTIPGQGQYRWRGDLNGNGIADAEEFEPVPYGGDYALLRYAGEERTPGSRLCLQLHASVRPSGVLREYTALLSYEHLARRRALLQELLPLSASSPLLSWAQLHLEQQLSLHPLGTFEPSLQGRFWSALFRVLPERSDLHSGMEFRAGGGLPLTSVLRLLLELSLLQEQRQPASALLPVSAFRGWQLQVQLPWQLLTSLQLVPQWQLLRGRAGEAASQPWAATTLGTGLRYCAPPLRAELNGQYRQRLQGTAAATPWRLGTLSQGWQWQFELERTLGALVLLLRYFGQRPHGAPWWHSLNGEVRMSL